jgi:choline dehydrogenase
MSLQDKKFDYIVVGAGSAGAVVAARLSEKPDCQVLLLEAGAPDHFWTRIPVGFAKLINNPAANWLYESEAEDSTGGRKIGVPRGKLLGGSSAINGMVYVRGQAQDYDHWAQLGNRGWSYEDVLPMFKRLESFPGGDDRFRGRDGPIKVKVNNESGPLVDALFAACEHEGLKRNPDYNGPIQDGVTIAETNIGNGVRMSTASCYLKPAKGRSNLQIETRALARQLLMDGTRCTGVRYAVGSEMREAYAAREVIVSTGSINSPQLLELSGIGRPEVLKAQGIDVRHALPGVGENLRDHWSPRMKWSITQPGVTYNDTMRGLGMVRHVLRYALKRDGFLAMSASPIRAYARSREGLASPDIGIAFMAFLMDNYALAPNRGLTAIAHQLRPESQGSVHIRSADAAAAPAIRFNFLSAELDRQVLLASIRITRKIMQAPALKAFRGDELSPGDGIRSDDEILEWVRLNAETTYHPVGTCKMGHDPLAVVDERLRVRGITGLRVADASIMPTLTSGNTNVPSIMIGEKAASMLREDATA